MSIITTWQVNNMMYNTIDGGVVTVYWSCTAQADTSEYAVEAGKLYLEPEASSGDFIEYDLLTESNVLSWVYDSLKEGKETAEEAKERIETNCIEKVEVRITKKNNQSSGMPWISEITAEETSG